MEILIKVYSSIVVMVLNLYMGITAVVATEQVSVAENYRASVTAQIENSNFNQDVIAACEQEAREMGYELEITNCVFDEENDIQLAEVALTYDYKMPLLGIEETRVTRGIAR